MLNQKNIDIIEDCISNSNSKFITNENPQFPSISYRYYNNALKIYNMLKTEPVNSYEIFASNGMGYQSFGMYKADNEKIYIIEATMDLSSYEYSLRFVYEIGHKMKEIIPEQI